MVVSVDDYDRVRNPIADPNLTSRCFIFQLNEKNYWKFEFNVQFCNLIVIEYPIFTEKAINTLSPCPTLRIPLPVRFFSTN